jgi:sialate O-acetylesterase
MKIMNVNFRQFIPVCTLGLGLMVLSCQPQKSALRLPSLFTNNMVLQQNSNAAIWGKANPGSTITVTGEWGASATAEAALDSSWLLKIATPQAGGPYTLTIQNNDSTLTLQNVLSGEVWLASGQSNMEMPLAGWPPNDTIQNSAAEIAAANYPNIRMFTVTRNIGAEELDDVAGNWAVCSPSTAPLFSATAFFFAKKLNAELNVPVGIIHSSWGGTPAESWIEGKILANDNDFKATIAALDSVRPQMKVLDAWLKNFSTIDVTTRPDSSDPLVGLNLFDSICSNPSLDDSTWQTMTLPTVVENTPVGEFDGAIWFRREIEIPQNWEGKELLLTLGAIDDRDVTYFNGHRIGGFEEAGKWQMVREYNIPANLVKAGKAVIAVKMIDTQGGGGFTSNPDIFTLAVAKNKKMSISLTGEWKYRVVALFRQNSLTLFDPIKDEYANKPYLSIQPGPSTASALYNAMIAPLVPYTIKGAIWYQGEANVGKANQYLRLMTMLINNWRTQFELPEMPFYATQLAPWNYSDVKGSSSANIRQAQLKTMQLPKTGMISTLDIGNVNNIHPCYKKEVGDRLALWALANDYGKAVVFSGPVFKAIDIRDNKAILSFTYTNDGLNINQSVPNQFEIAGNDGVFYPASTTIEGETIICSSPKVTVPANVRYAFTNGAQASLFNGAGLPAPSFSTETILND